VLQKRICDHFHHNVFVVFSGDRLFFSFWFESIRPMRCRHIFNGGRNADEPVFLARADDNSVIAKRVLDLAQGFVHRLCLE
jgi:hypothetical protein